MAECRTVTFKKSRSGRPLKRGKTVSFCAAELSPRKMSRKRAQAKENLRSGACKSPRIGTSRKLNPKQRAALRKACRSPKLRVAR